MGNAMKVIAVVLFVILIYALGWAFKIGRAHV